MKKIIAFILLVCMLIGIMPVFANSDYYVIDSNKGFITRIEPDTEVSVFKQMLSLTGKIVKVYKDQNKTQEVTSGLIGTGMFVEIEGDTKLYTSSVVGDFDGDGKATQVELTNVIKHIVGISGKNLTGLKYESGDLTGEGIIDQRDLTKFINYIVMGRLDLNKKDIFTATITLNVKSVLTSSAKVDISILDKLGEMPTNPIFTFYIKKDGELDTSYVEVQSNTNTICEFTGLNQGTKYIVKVETIDKLGNVGSKEIEFTTSKLDDYNLKIEDPIWANEIATVKIKNNSPYPVEYQVNNTNGTWIKGSIVTNLKYGDVVYARLTDEKYHSTYVESLIGDDIDPIVEVDLLTGTDFAIVVADAVDNESGILDTVTYKFSIKETGALASTYIEIQNTQSNRCDFQNLLSGKDYTVKVEVEDIAGNVGSVELNFTTEVEDVDEDSINISEPLWNNGSATVNILTSSIYKVEYQVNSVLGSWREGKSVNLLNNGDVLYVRLVDGTNVIDSCSFTIVDLIFPTIPDFTISEITDRSFLLTLNELPIDNESGVKDIDVYVYRTDIPSGIGKPMNSKEIFIDHLDEETEYEVFIAVEDNAGNYAKGNKILVKTEKAIYAKLYTDGLLTISLNNDNIPGKIISKDFGKINPLSGEIGYDSNIVKVEIMEPLPPTRCNNWFSFCRNLTQIVGLENLNTSIEDDMSGMFNECEKLEEVNISNFDTSKVTNMRAMFNRCYSLKKIVVGDLDTSKVTDMSYMFAMCSELKQVDIDGLDTENVTDMSGMFWECYCLESLDFKNFNTEKVQSMSYMFEDCMDLRELDLNSFNTKEVLEMNNLFKWCIGLEKLNISNFDVSKVTSMSYMFDHCDGLTELDVSKFNTSNVTDMSGMFYFCQKLKIIDVSKFDTSNVTNMANMFSNCRNLESVDVSKFDTSKVINMHAMFCYSDALNELDISSFDTSHVENMNSMFFFCTSLNKILVGPKWKMAAQNEEMFYQCGVSSVTNV